MLKRWVLWPNHVDTSPAPTLRSLTLLHPVTEVPFLLSPILTPFGTNEDLRQLINKQNKPQETLFISLCTGFLFKSHLISPLNFKSGNRRRVIVMNSPPLWTSGLPLDYFYIVKLHKCKMWASPEYRYRHVVLFCLHTYTHLPDYWSNVIQNS